PCAYPWRQDLRHGVRELLDDRPHEPAQRALMKTFRRGVHRDQPAGMQSLVFPSFDDLVIRMLEVEGALVAHHLTVQHEPLATLEHAPEVRAAEPAGGGVTALVAKHGREGHAASSRRRRGVAPHPPTGRVAP